MDKPTPVQRSNRNPKEADPRAVAVTIRWAQVLPVDFDGEDVSLTQAQLAILK